MNSFDNNEWSYSQVATLFDLATKNVPVPVIARSLSKTEAAIRQKAFLMGLTVRPGNSFYNEVEENEKDKGA